MLYTFYIYFLTSKRSGIVPFNELKKNFLNPSVFVPFFLRTLHNRSISSENIKSPGPGFLPEDEVCAQL